MQEAAAGIKPCRQPGLTIEETKKILAGGNGKAILKTKAHGLQRKRAEPDVRLSIIHHILEEDEMKYPVTVKEIPPAVVSYSELRPAKCSDMRQAIPTVGAECKALNPNLNDAEPPRRVCE